MPVPKPIILTPAEKLSLLMLCDLYEHLEIKDGFDPKFIREAIHSGNCWALGQKMPVLVDCTETPVEVVSATIKILDMWWRLRADYQALDPKQKEATAPELTESKLTFPGFGGNFEIEYLGAARFLTGPLGQFASLDSWDHMDAHLPMVDTYRRMLPIFEAEVGSAPGRRLAAAQIIRVLAAFPDPQP